MRWVITIWREARLCLTWDETDCTEAGMSMLPTTGFQASLLAPELLSIVTKGRCKVMIVFKRIGDITKAPFPCSD